jgi:hypothetical protein
MGRAAAPSAKYISHGRGEKLLFNSFFIFTHQFQVVTKGEGDYCTAEGGWWGAAVMKAPLSMA